MGLYSHLPLEGYRAFRLGDDQGFSAQQCVLRTGGRPLTLLNVHPRSIGGQLRHPPASAHAVDVRDLLLRVHGIDGPLIVAGDLNLTDRHAAYAALTRRLRDAHREAGWGRGFTFRPSSASPALWRIDYVLHSPELAVLDADLGEYGSSDHRPLIAILAWSP